MLFPTNFRFRGTGLANAAGRITVILMPYIFINPILASFGFKGVIGALAGRYILTAILSFVIGIDIQGKSLETINQESSNAEKIEETVEV